MCVCVYVYGVGFVGRREGDVCGGKVIHVVYADGVCVCVCVCVCMYGVGCVGGRNGDMWQEKVMYADGVCVCVFV